MQRIYETCVFPILTDYPQRKLTWAKVVMAMFGISHTVNTRVGNDFVRGVSGGERKRVTIAEATLSFAPLQAWDNSTRGTFENYSHDEMFADTSQVWTRRMLSSSARHFVPSAMSSGLLLALPSTKRHKLPTMCLTRLQSSMKVA